MLLHMFLGMDRQPLKKCLHISGILSDLLDRHRIEIGREMARINECWEFIVGEAIAKNTKPAAYHKNVLIVNVDSSVWVQQLQFLKADILARMREVLGNTRVDDVKFKVGPLSL